jgi:hypothetical protein
VPQIEAESPLGAVSEMSSREVQPSQLSPVDGVAVVLLRGIEPHRVSDYMRHAEQAPFLVLSDPDAELVARLWRALPCGEPDRSHVPTYGLSTRGPQDQPAVRVAEASPNPHPQPLSQRERGAWTQQEVGARALLPLYLWERGSGGEGSRLCHRGRIMRRRQAPRGFLRSGAPIVETSVCWECNNTFGLDRNGELPLGSTAPPLRPSTTK